MQPRNFEEAVAAIIREDTRYAADAYRFVRGALDYTIKMLNKPETGPGRHVTGRELLEGFRLFALQEFGPMAFRVLQTWGLNRTEDVGEIVFNLVGKGVLGKTPQDRKEDFARGYDFRAAFVTPFLPTRPLKKTRSGKGRTARKGGFSPVLPRQDPS